MSAANSLVAPKETSKLDKDARLVRTGFVGVVGRLLRQEDETVIVRVRLEVVRESVDARTEPSPRTVRAGDDERPGAHLTVKSTRVVLPCRGFPRS
jgi:hypothetical protein